MISESYDSQAARGQSYDAKTKGTGFAGPKDPRGIAEIKEDLVKLYGPLPAGVEPIFRAIRRHNMKVVRTKGPAGVFIIAGPSGSSKTFFSQMVAQALHGREMAYVMLNGGDYADETEIRKLVGAPPSYMGHRETVPILSAKAFEDAKSNQSGLTVIIIDEAEQLSKRVHPLLLSIMDERNGSITLGDNTVLSFANTLILMTTNVGSDVDAGDNPFGIIDSRAKMTLGVRSDRYIDAALRRIFGTAIYNRMRRLGGVITFPQLGSEQVLDIVQRRVHEAVSAFNWSAHITSKAAGVYVAKKWRLAFLEKYNVNRGIREGLGGLDIEVTDVLLDAIEAGDVPARYNVRFEELGKVKLVEVQG